MRMIDKSNCEQCGAEIMYDSCSNPAPMCCGSTCQEAWEAANPGEWVKVEDLSRFQRAELDALLGQSIGGRS